jgi:hypothetical protein
MKAKDCKVGDKIIWVNYPIVNVGTVKSITKTWVIVNGNYGGRSYLHHPQQVGLWTKEKEERAELHFRELSNAQNNIIKEVKSMIGYEEGTN